MRNPNPHAKTHQLVIKSEDPLDIQKFQAVREIVARNPELTIKKALMPGVEAFLRKHHWPPGNSQTILGVFTEAIKRQQRCEFPQCQQPAQFADYPKPPGDAKVLTCARHHAMNVEQRLLRSSKRLRGW